jgi:hypothetical protein
MSYTYLQEQGGESSAASFAGIPPSVLSRLNLTAGKFCSKGSETESCHASQYGTMLEHSTVDLGADGLTLSAAGSLARTLARQERALESPESAADYGPRCQESFARFNHHTSLWKTAQCSLFGGLDSFSGTWPEWGMMLDGECFHVEMWEGGTCAIGSGFSLPTPGKSEFKGASSKRFHQSEDYRGAKMAEGVRTLKTDPIYLSPSFCELSMMWPITWTELAPLATDKFHQWLRSHGKPSEAQ